MKYLLLFLVLFNLQAPIFAQEDSPKYSIYYLAIGNGDYEHDFRKFKTRGFQPFENLPEAKASASIMETILKRFANAKGINLSSSGASYITLDTIIVSLSVLIDMIVKDNPKNPLLLFYYCGHGITDPTYNDHFLIPGNFTYIISPDNKYDLYHRGYVFPLEVNDKALNVRSLIYVFQSLTLAQDSVLLPVVTNPFDIILLP